MKLNELPLWLPYATDTENIPHRKERLQALGNTIVPEVATIPLTRVARMAQNAPAP